MVNSTNRETSGFLTTVFDSFKSNVEERLRSPFAGAFLISWLVINWKPIYILLLSDKAVEFRIERVSAVYFSTANTLWWPLLASFVAIIFFYILSSIYLYIYEFYGVVKTKIEMKFDTTRWVSPDEYILAKQKNQNKFDSLLKLATDNTKIMDDARLRAEDAETRSAELQLKYQELYKNNEISSNKIEALEKTNIELVKNHEALSLLVSEKSKKNSLLANELIQANELINEALTDMENTYSKDKSKVFSLSDFTEALENNKAGDSRLKRMIPPDSNGNSLAKLVSSDFSMKNGRKIVDKLKSHLNTKITK